jgi:hypothetical protein
MLGAFFGPRYLDWWLSYAKNPNRMSPYNNHWLVRRSAANALARGLVRLDRRQPSMVEVSFNCVHVYGFHLILSPSTKSAMFSSCQRSRSRLMAYTHYWAITHDRASGKSTPAF